MILPDLLKYQPTWNNARRYLGEDVNPVLTYLLLLRAGNNLEVLFTPFFEEYELSDGRFSVLMCLFDAPGQVMPPSQLADSLGVTRATITKLLESLERSGLVERQLNPSDRRVWLITLTSQARVLLEKMLPSHFQRIKRVMEIFSIEDQEQLVSLLLKLEAHLATI
ncbi:MarR family winged helix-turn-helix transcriptional regulator [Peribacillus muralis]|uniref:MarR family winged helix-turn-helix transcriptional regulator n=1 Tax=Peribacillus muralis TaxID=264697 RepID=UPI0007098614|nr:MarR family transcriptional regulator [Peribacillus muralis]